MIIVAECMWHACGSNSAKIYIIEVQRCGYVAEKKLGSTELEKLAELNGFDKLKLMLICLVLVQFKVYWLIFQF